MKVKQRPEDFQVEELTDVAPSQGPFALYRLEKRGWSTPDALAALRRLWKIEPRRLSYGGLKDRHALTRQFLTIHHGPRRHFSHQGLRLTYLGQLPRPYASADIRANRFRLTLRDLPPDHLPAIRLALDEVRACGVPNYFDDQRFGSVTPDGEFIARHLVHGRFEDALHLALAAPYEHDRADAKREKALLRSHWGDWAYLVDHLLRGHARGLADYLRQHPGDFKGAVARLRPELRGLYLSAYQSHLWNRLLARWLQMVVPADRLISVPLKLEVMPFWRSLDASTRDCLAALSLPLLSARLHLPPDDPLSPLVAEVLAAEGLELRQMQIKGVRELFFSRGDRPAFCLPQGLRAQDAPDDLHPGRLTLILSFDLPRGSYATLVVKRLQSAAVVPAPGK